MYCKVVFASKSGPSAGVDRFFLTLLPPKKSLDDPNSMEAQLAFKPADEQIVPLRQVGTGGSVVAVASSSNLWFSSKHSTSVQGAAS